ncbi:DUF222 domain-containing protein [Microbacterium sp. NPDC058345]|uniref:HNH endonuclease signature motif containing protein n=1 Tax=Microbacterium sp. NPDC058345 TaxID=3346455 RepID=UPI00364C43A3
MALFTEIEHQVAVLRDLLGADTGANDLVSSMSALDGDALLQGLQAAATLARCAERISIAGAGVAAERSTREAGQDGLAQSRGHRSSAAMIQDIAGVGRAEAQRQVRLGTSLMEGSLPVDGASSAAQDESPTATDESATSDAAAAPPSWHAPLSAALLQGRISAAQHDALLRGLGAPPDESSETREAWSAAAEQLIAEAAERTVDELRTTARTVRDGLDPQGAERRFAERYERRSFRMWTDQDGVEHGHFTFDDEGAAWMRTIRDSALRPRRGGPRFIDEAERERAEELTADTRTNDQLGYDLFIDVLRAGALADADSVFGTRQAGVRVIQIVDQATGNPVSGYTEDYGRSLPPQSVAQRMCDTGAVSVTVDSCGNPLDVGREHRLFTPKQRIALAGRDGGCLWKGCDRPSSYCEAHHIDEWQADKGRTDIDRGVLLCRHHHMQLHHGGWRITRVGKGDFVLHPPGDEPSIPLRRRLGLTLAISAIDPPLRRFRPVA